MTAAWTLGREIELGVAVLLLGTSIYLYRSQRNANQGYGSQGAVLLLVIAAILGIHALGLLKYHPSKAEADYMVEHSR